MSIAYLQSENMFVAGKVFPVIPVQKQSDRYFVYTKGDWFRDDVKKRAPGSESAGGGFSIDNTPSYYADVYSLHKDVDDQTRQNADIPLDMDRDATRYVTQKHLLKREKVFVSNYMKTGVWGSDPVPATKWDAAGSHPISDVENYKNTVHAATGFRPNTMVMTRDVFTTLKNHADVIDRFKYTSARVLTPEILAALFELDKFLIVDAVENTALEGKTDAMDLIVKNSALLCYSNPAPSILQPSAGYTFQWVGLYGAGNNLAVIKKFRIEEIESDRIEGSMAWDQKLVGSDLGVFINAILT
jgi:hypothetical protein